MSERTTIATWVVLCMWVLVFGGACSSTTGGETESELAGEEPIGTATMEPDGTIVLWLRAEDPDTGSVGQAMFRYPPSHERYQEILDHLGGLEPGQEKLVPPFPDD